MRALVLSSLFLAGPAGAQSSASFPPMPGDEEPEPEPDAEAAPPPSPSPARPEPQPAPAPAPTAPLPGGASTTAPTDTVAPAPEVPPTAGNESLPAQGAIVPQPAISLSRPLYLPYEPGTEVPEGYRVKRQRFTGLMVAGGVTFAAGYVYAFASGISNDFDNGEGWLAAPIVGPFAALAARKIDKCNIDVDGTDDVNDLVASEEEVEECFEDALDEAIRLAVITADGVIQVVGATLFVGGAAGGEKRLVREEPRFTAGPRTFGGRGLGFGVSGSF